MFKSLKSSYHCILDMNRAYRKNFYQRLKEWCEQEKEKV